MNYHNMLLEELIKEAAHTDNKLALEIVRHLNDLEEIHQQELEEEKFVKSDYDEGWEHAIEACINKLEEL